MTLLTWFFDDGKSCCERGFFGDKTTMSLFTDFHPYLLSLVYPQTGGKSNALSSFFSPSSAAARQSADSSVVYKGSAMICFAVISFCVNLIDTIIRLSLD